MLILNLKEGEAIRVILPSGQEGIIVYNGRSKGKCHLACECTPELRLFRISETSEVENVIRRIKDSKLKD